MKINNQILFDRLEAEGISSGNARVLYDWEPSGEFPVFTYIYNNIFEISDHSIVSGINADVKPGFDVGVTDNPISSVQSRTGAGYFAESDLISVGHKVEYDNWTAFINFNEPFCGNRLDQEKGRILLSSMQTPTAESGFMVGVNGANKLFYEYNDTSGTRKVRTLNKVLGEKNLVSISRSATTMLTLGVYDPVKNVGTYESFNVLEAERDQRWHIGGTFEGINLSPGGTNDNENYKGFEGYVDNFLLLDSYLSQGYLNNVSDLFFLTGYSPEQSVVSQVPFNVATGYFEEDVLVGQGITGHQWQAVNVEDNDGTDVTAYTYAPLSGDIVESRVFYMKDQSTMESGAWAGSSPSTRIQPEARFFDYSYIKEYAYPCILWDSSFDTANTYELYSCDIYTNKIGLQAELKNKSFQLDTGIYTAGENVNIYLNGKIQESGVNYEITPQVEVSGISRDYTNDDTMVYDIITGEQYWWNYTGWQGTLLLGGAHDKDLYLDQLKLVSGVNYSAVNLDLEVYASTILPTGRMALVPRYQNITNTSTSTIGNHCKCFDDGLISEQIWVGAGNGGLRNAENSDYIKKTRCDISCSDPDGIPFSSTDDGSYTIFNSDQTIILTGIDYLHSTTTTTATPIISSDPLPATTTTTTQEPEEQTFYYGWDCSTLDSYFPDIIKFYDTANVITGNQWPTVVKLDNGKCVSNFNEETALITESSLPNTNGETFDDLGTLSENTACLECLEELPTTTSGPTTTPPPSCEYVVNATLNWDTVSANRADLDIYVRTLNGCDNQSKEVYWGNVNHTVDQDNHMSLNSDAHPLCYLTPAPPETILATFKDNRDFEIWWNQHSICASAVTDPIQQLSVENTGQVAFQVNGNTVNAGETYWIVNTEDPNVGGNLAYVGHGNGDQSNFQNGTTISITGCQACGG